MRIYSPLGEVGEPSIGLAKSPKSLKGVKVGILDNTKPNAGVFMQEAVKALEKTYGAKLVQVQEKNAALPAPEDSIQALDKEVQVVLTGSAD